MSNQAQLGRMTYPAKTIEESTLLKGEKYFFEGIAEQFTSESLIKWLFQWVYTSIDGIETRFTYFDFEASSCQSELPYLWRHLTHMAKYLPFDDEAHQYKLVAIVAGLRASGPLHRINRNTEQPEELITSEGRAWTDLPFFSQEVYKCWTPQGHIQSVEHWKNFNAFLARLTSVHAFNFLPFALRTIRAALEDSRPMVATGNTSFDPTSVSSSVEEHLPAALIWLEYGAGEIALRIETAAKLKPKKLDVRCGDLAISSGLESTDFDIERLKFWMFRLEKLRFETKFSENFQTEVQRHFEGLIHQHAALQDKAQMIPD